MPFAAVMLKTGWFAALDGAAYLAAGPLKRRPDRSTTTL
jgi:hypothetical protein